MKNFINRNGNVYIYNLTYAFRFYRIFEKRQNGCYIQKDSRDIVITYVCNVNNIPVENNYKQIMQKKIEKDCKCKAFTIIHFLDNIVLGKTLKTTSNGEG